MGSASVVVVLVGSNDGIMHPDTVFYNIFPPLAWGPVEEKSLLHGLGYVLCTHPLQENLCDYISDVSLLTHGENSDFDPLLSQVQSQAMLSIISIFLAATLTLK